MALVLVMVERSYWPSFVYVNRSEETTRKRAIESEMEFWLVQPGIQCNVPSAASSVHPYPLAQEARRSTNLRPCSAPGSAHPPGRMIDKAAAKLVCRTCQRKKNRYRVLHNHNSGEIKRDHVKLLVLKLHGI